GSIGNAVQAHLFTREAMALYLSKLKPHGLVVMSLSSPSLELASVIAGSARANNAIVRRHWDSRSQTGAREMAWVPSLAVVARAPEDFGVLATSRSWPALDVDPFARIWTDDYPDVAGAWQRRLQARASARRG